MTRIVGDLFGGGGGGSDMPPPPPPPPAPSLPPRPGNPKVIGAGQRMQSKAGALAGANIATSPYGVPQEATTSAKKLLGE